MAGMERNICHSLCWQSMDSLCYRLPQFKEEPKSYVGTNMKKVWSENDLLSLVQTLISQLQGYVIPLLSKDALLVRHIFLGPEINLTVLMRNYSLMDTSPFPGFPFLALDDPPNNLLRQSFMETDWDLSAGLEVYAGKDEGLTTLGLSFVGRLEAMPHILATAGLDWAHACSSLCWRGKSSLTPNQRILKQLGKEWGSEEWPLSVLPEALELRGLEWGFFLSP